mgnify:CR=1 FL=1
MTNPLLTAIGLIIIGDGIVSIAYSTDQRGLTNIGRIIRIGIGAIVLNEGIKK